MIRNVAQARKHVIVIIGVLLVLDAAIVAVLLSPAVKSGAGSAQQYRALNTALVQKRVQTVPAMDMDRKLADARREIGEFYTQGFPNRYSEISKALSKAAEQSHVDLVNVHYDTKTLNPSLSTVDLSMDLSGPYDAQIRFINALERSPMFVVIDSVNLAEAQGGSVRLGLKLQTFLRTGQS